MKCTYLAAVYGEGDSLWCQFPDLPNVITEGGTIEELQINASNALETILECMKEAPPVPSGWQEALEKALPENGAVAFLMPVSAYLHPRQVSICLAGTDTDFQRIKDAAKRFGTTRSALMVKASLDYIERLERGDED